MRNVPALTRREVASYLHTPVAHVLLTSCIGWAGFWFYRRLSLQPLANLEEWMAYVYILPILIVPLITMRLLAEELSMGSMEMLMTAPVSEVEVVIGKYLGAAALF